jgi:drug/metabolite transporter (DMT)-like permease
VNGSAAPPSRTPVLLHAALLAVSLLFGANTVIAKVALREVEPFVLVVIRTAGTAAVLFAVSGWRRRSEAPRPRLARSDFGHIFLYSLLGASINQVCFLAGLARSTATNASLMVVVVPVLTLAFAVALRRERASVTGLLGIAFGLAGALLLILPRGGVDIARHAAVGNLLLLLSGASYALYLVLTRPILARLGAMRVVSWTFLLAALTVFPLGMRGLSDLAVSGLSLAGWASVAYVIVGGTAVPYLLNNWALARVQSSIVAVYVLLQPVVAASFGRIFLHEQFAPHTAVAAVLVVAGVFLSAWRRP